MKWIEKVWLFWLIAGTFFAIAFLVATSETGIPLFLRISLQEVIAGFCYLFPLLLKKYAGEAGGK